ncbi:SDR family oxidoreductase [Nocardioides panacis]|uniref:SDR family oxidoreductase n=1 Tax=Nocardioides panacis TaxID=2849501 RepID=A0A975Y2L0_9ACTN|nr:SDR family oxidoreductase [Nocardioides panacis]QWZ10671.1 SDR family oxidoreductase [Nocardioides panacis]
MLGVTGSTGHLGGRIARLLAAEGVQQRLVVRTPAKAPQLPGSTVVQASYADGAAVRRALEGLDTVLMVSAAEAEDRLEEHRTFVDAAAAAGVRRLVYTSFYGAAPDATFLLARDHHLTERHIERSGMVPTFLRDNLYADFFPLLAGADGVIRGPADDGRVAAVAQDDIAAAAVAVLLDPGAHAGRTYELTGPAAITLTEAAATMSRVLGRDFSFVDETLEEAYASRSAYGAADWQVAAWVSTYTAIAAGELAGVTGDVELLTGRPATSLEELLTPGG